MYGTDIFELTKDRPLITPEWHEQNDFYGHASILKRFTGLPEDYPLRCVVEHGANLPGDTWKVDLAAPLPVLLTFSEASAEKIDPKYKKTAVAIGPRIAYAENLYDDSAMRAEKEKLGRNLLAFLPHSTHHIETRYNFDFVCEHLQQMKKDYDTVSVSIYWKDCTPALVGELEAHGFFCVSAGHIYDRLFLNRLKSIISLSDATIHYGIGTNVGYCAYMQKPLQVKSVDFDFASGRQEYLRILSNSIIVRKKYDHGLARYLENMQTPSKTVMRALSYVYGLDCVKNKNILLRIFQKAEEIYGRMP